MKRSWQDRVFAVGGVLLGLGLVPLVTAETPAPWTGSLLTGVVLAMYSGAFLTLGLRLGAVTVGVNALMWFAVLAKAFI